MFQGVYWVKVDDFPWWPAIISPIEHVSNQTDSSVKGTSNDPTDKSVSVTLLELNKTYAYNSRILESLSDRFTIPNKNGLLKYETHSFSKEDVPSDLHALFEAACCSAEEIHRNYVKTEPVECVIPHGNSQKRQDYISWDEYFMGLACLSAMRSKDPNTQVGACIVNSQNQIVGIGYNGFPRGCDDDALPWGRDSENELETKYMYVCHAEMNAILNINTSNARGCRMYVSLFPCNNCCKMIIQSGIEEVIYLSDKYHDSNMSIAARKMFDMANVKYTPYSGKKDDIVIHMH